MGSKEVGDLLGGEEVGNERGDIWILALRWSENLLSASEWAYASDEAV